MFERLLGTRNIDLDLPGSPPGSLPEIPPRHFATGEDLRRDVANARVWGGLHFRFSTEVGGDLGTRVANWALAHEFRPTRGCRR